MRTLAIDTSTEACSVALFVGDQLVDAAHREIGRGHAERLVSMIAELDGGGRAQTILVGCGPGSFTGVRVGIAAARALALGWQGEVRGFNSLALVAAAADGDALVVMDGGHGEWLIQPFGPAGVPRADHVSLTPDQAEQSFSGVIIGNRAIAYAERFGGAPVAALPNARDALNIAAGQANWPPRPVYARAPDARMPA